MWAEGVSLVTVAEPPLMRPVRSPLQVVVAARARAAAGAGADFWATVACLGAWDWVPPAWAWLPDDEWSPD